MVGDFHVAVALVHCRTVSQHRSTGTTGVVHVTIMYLKSSEPSSFSVRLWGGGGDREMVGRGVFELYWASDVTEISSKL